MDRDKIEITLAGSGGQGLILAGLVLADAAGIEENLEIVQTVEYGPEARLGTSRSDVIISKKPISYPKVQHPDVLVNLSQDAYNKFIRLVKKGGTVIVDTFNVKNLSTVDGPEVIAYPFTEIVRNKIGTPLVLNMFVLGFLAKKFDIVKLESLYKAVDRRVKKYHDLNKKALMEGYSLE
uniref:2-oxoacid:ferredoxin oxidoreductase subunit gamma n=1 Tax=candidate division WOR-3 bacterium TaxID=2052148 RepID=A0A7V3KMW0_UNCW3